MKKPGLGLKAQLQAEKAAVRPTAKAGDSQPRTGREGKKPVIGYFSVDLSKALAHMRADEGVTLQALLGEAIDLLLENRGKHPFGER